MSSEGSDKTTNKQKTPIFDQKPLYFNGEGPIAP